MMSEMEPTELTPGAHPEVPRDELGCCVDKRYGSPRGCDSETCMRLPGGATCAACAHIARCEAFGFTNSADNTYCSFFPRLFIPKARVR